MSISLPAPSDRISSSINPTCGFSRWPLLRLQSPYAVHTYSWSLSGPSSTSTKADVQLFWHFPSYMSWKKMHSVGVNECPSDCIFWEVWKAGNHLFQRKQCRPICNTSTKLSIGTDHVYIDVTGTRCHWEVKNQCTRALMLLLVSCGFSQSDVDTRHCS